jgi:hypothetical protein
MSGLHTTMFVAGLVALAGAAMGPLLRSSGHGHDPAEEAGGDGAELPPA